MARARVTLLVTVLMSALCVSQASSNIDRSESSDVFSIPFTLPLARLDFLLNSTKDNHILSKQTENCEEITRECQTPDITEYVLCALQNLLDNQTSSMSGYVSAINAGSALTSKDNSRKTSIRDVEIWLIFLKSAVNHQTRSRFAGELNTTLYAVMNTLGPCVSSQGYQLDESSYKNNVGASVADIISMLGSNIYLCGPSACYKDYPNNTANCYLNLNSSSLYCIEKCTQFKAENDCASASTLYGIYVQGTCSYDRYLNPFCDCGSSVGNILNNFYDGDRCVSVAFIIAMSASAGGFILILLIASLYVVHKQRQYLLVMMERAVELQKRVAKYTKTGTDENSYEKLNENDPTLEAIKITETPRKNSYELSKSTSAKSDKDLYDGVDLYPYLRKDPLVGSPKMARSENGIDSSSKKSSINNNKNNNYYDNNTSNNDCQSAL